MIKLTTGQRYKTKWSYNNIITQTEVEVTSFDGNNYSVQIFMQGIFSGYGLITWLGELVEGGIHTSMYVVVEDEVPQLSFGYQRKCDCGGYKTYNSWEKEYHSHWCSVNKGYGYV